MTATYYGLWALILAAGIGAALGLIGMHLYWLWQERRRVQVLERSLESTAGVTGTIVSYYTFVDTKTGQSVRCPGIPCPTEPPK